MKNNVSLDTNPLSLLQTPPKKLDVTQTNSIWMTVFPFSPRTVISGDCTITKSDSSQFGQKTKHQDREHMSQTLTDAYEHFKRQGGHYWLRRWELNLERVILSPIIKINLYQMFNRPIDLHYCKHWNQQFVLITFWVIIISKEHFILKIKRNLKSEIWIK